MSRRHAATIAGPAAFVGRHAQRTLFAVRDELHAVGVDTLRDQVLAHGVRTTIAESKVVFTGAALIAVTFDGQRTVRVLVEPLRLRTEAGLVFSVEVITVEVELDRVADDASIDAPTTT